MDFELTEAQAAVRDRARQVAREVLAPRAAELDRTERFPTASFAALAEAGLLGLNVPRALGGTEAGVVALAAALEEVAAACPSTAVGMSVTHMVAETIARFGSPALRERYVPPLVRGDAVAGAFALSEPDAGSDAASLRTTARRDGDHWVLDGTKMWITSGAYAGVLVVMARTGAPDSRHRGISAFVLEPGFPGLSTARPEDKTGLRGSNTVQLVLEACRVPAGNPLGEEGQGFAIAMTALDGGRITIGAMANGMARAALDASARWVAARPEVAESGAAQARLADMATRLDTARLLVMRAAWLKERSAGPHGAGPHGAGPRGSGPHGSGRFTREAAMAKLFATEGAKAVTGHAVALMGLDGATDAFPVERLLRDARVTTIFEGTSEIQKLVIAREVLASLTR